MHITFLLCLLPHLSAGMKILACLTGVQLRLGSNFIYKLSHDFLRLEVDTKHLDANSLVFLEMDFTNP